jgi:hypoxanthine phosphoribosyltransferase
LVEMGEEFTDLYIEKDPLIIGLLTGATKFSHALIDSMVKINPIVNLDYDFIRTGAYGQGQKQQEVRLLGDLSPSTTVEDRFILLLDDITDSGKSMNVAVKHVQGLGAAEVKVAVLIDRTIDKNRPVDPDHSAFKLDIPDWVVGYGLNGPGAGHGGGRTLPFVAKCIIQEETNQS